MHSKAAIFIKQYFFALALAATFIGFSAFKYVESTQQPEDGWYEITSDATDPDDESLQQIGEKLDNDPPAVGSGCATANSGDRCAIHLTFDAEAIDVPSTVSEAEADDDVTVGQDSNYP
ncbi:hypothetical protein [Parapedobacter tibetensis]|uniref:hypothetical protein n=1 Tax=Parapedobacter tibetensis TaxID=2972951 RepID=UPI00214DBCF4|nr:hypothetical protein [Parapedobacter tibetensis]